MEVNREHDSELGARPGLRLTARPSEQAIKRQLLSDAVQHPATLLPLAVVFACVVYLLLLSPVFSRGLWATAVLAACGVATTASFAWRYFFCYAEEYALRERRLMDRQGLELARFERRELNEKRAFLESGFLRIGSGEGLKALTELVAEYEKLRPALVHHHESDPLAMSRVPVLAEETYRRGLSVLSDALELMITCHDPGRERLKNEVAELEREIEVTKDDEMQAGRLEIKEYTLASRKQSLEMLDQLQLRADQLLFQAYRCEATLHRTRIELAGIRTASSETSVDSVIEALQGTTNQVKEVQEELKGLGY